jgi:hypothetical protein
MTPLKNMSPKKIVAISLLVWFVPFLPLPFVFRHDLSFPAALLLLPGAAICDLFLVVLRKQGHIPELLGWFLGILTPVSFAVLAFLASRWCKSILIAGFFLASGLSWFAYILMRA